MEDYKARYEPDSSNTAPPSKSEKELLLSPQPKQSLSTSSTQAFQTSFASLSLHSTDCLRTIEFPSDAITTIQNAITQSWPAGIQRKGPYGCSYEFKLSGRPWLGGASDSMNARRLMQRLFRALWDSGWLLYLSTDLSKKQTDKDTLIFRHQSPPPAPSEWMSVSFSRHDRIRLMDAPQDLRDAVVAELRDFVQESRAYTGIEGVWELKIKGYPWYANGEATMVSRVLALKLVTVLERFGFTVYASIDQKATTQDQRSESDTWHCRRGQGWAPGVPVYHN